MASGWPLADGLLGQGSPPSRVQYSVRCETLCGCCVGHLASDACASHVTLLVWVSWLVCLLQHCLSHRLLPVQPGWSIMMHALALASLVLYPCCCITALNGVVCLCEHVCQTSAGQPLIRCCHATGCSIQCHAPAEPQAALTSQLLCNDFLLLSHGVDGP
jgi:hypothetical protein